MIFRAISKVYPGSGSVVFSDATIFADTLFFQETETPRYPSALATRLVAGASITPVFIGRSAV